jgi:DNA-binding response OmpR family regulator
MMPALDGYATLEEIRGDPATAAMLFLCLTARAEHNDMQRAVHLGADDYLTKPFTTDELLASIAGISAKRAGTDATRAGTGEPRPAPSVRTSSGR